MCTTLCLDNSGQDLLNRLSNAVYEQARAGDLQVTSFPSFDPILSALKSGSTANAARSYRVTCQRHDQLLVLESFAKRWLDDPQFDERAREVIKLHNEEYNASEDFMMAAERPGLLNQEVVTFPRLGQGGKAI